MVEQTANEKQLNETKTEGVVEVKNNIGTVLSNDIEVFKVLYADREKINKFKEITFEMSEINYDPAIVVYRESTLTKEIFKKVKDLFYSLNDNSENNLDVAKE